jgi:GNAT superfamily N-acetyltransferase
MPDEPLSAATLERLRNSWAAHLGIPPADLFRSAMQVVTHGPELADYNGVLAFFRDRKVLVSLPANRAESLRALIPRPPLTPNIFADAFRDLASAVIGPAFLGYTDSVSEPSHPVHLLIENDASLIESLRSACDATEWEHGGSSVGSKGLSGILIDGRLVALAGYEIWGGVIAHISVIAHPEFRGRNLGRRVVARAAAHALDAGLIPQYRTLETNLPSMRIAHALGFQKYATSVAIRLKAKS